MDMDWNEQQKLLKNVAREFLERECPTSMVRECERSPEGYSPALWKKMADLGWMGLMIPEEYGGAGGGLLDLAVIFEEMGRFAVPSPFLNTVVLCGLPILEVGTAEQKHALLPQIASGDMVLSMALTEPSAKYTADGVQMRAQHRGDHYVLKGTKLFVEDARMARYLLCVVRTGIGATPEEGITLLLVDGTSRGITMTPLTTTALDKQFEVVFDGVEVSKDNVLGQEGKGWPVVARALQKGVGLQCAEMVGGAAKVLEMTVNYVKSRVQFGRPIGTFQAVQHSCANMVMDLDNARLATLEALWRLDSGLPADKEVALAKAWTGPAYARITREAHQLHGGIGFMMEYDLHLWSRRAKAMELKFGTPTFWQEAFAKAVGL